MTNQLKKILLFVLPVIALSLMVLWPSFNLHLTGDDYLGLWRYHYYLDNITLGNDWKNTSTDWNNFNFFFTDYGPQDSMTALIHYFFGFQPRYYYIISYLLRLAAAFSFFPLIKYLTNNRRAAYISVIFFAVCTAGLETTDWSFNMPSYIAIAMLNIFLLTYLKAKEKLSLKLTLLAGLLFYLTLISQPIRMTFLPIFVIVLELYSLTMNLVRHSVKKRNPGIIKNIFLRIIMFICIAIFFYLTGFVGNSVGAGETFKDRINGGWLKVIGNNAAMIKPFIEHGEYQVFAYPIAQLGSVIFPTNLIPANYQPNPFAKALYKLSLPLLLIFSAIILLYQKESLMLLRKNTKKKPSKLLLTEKRKTVALIAIAILLAGIWTTYSFLTFIQLTQFPFNKSQYISLLTGGYIIIFIGFLFIQYFKEEKLAQGFFLALLLTVLSFITPWSRNPTFLFDTIGRYLIVPAAGLTLIVGMILGSPKTIWTKTVSYSMVLTLMAIHMYASFQYLHHLSVVRGIAMTEKIRTSIPKLKHATDSNIPIMVYLEPKDNEVIHHSLKFGFPVIMGAQYNYFNVWHIAATDIWDEVVAAHKDGSSLKRFSIPIKPVKLENIYSFWWNGSELIETSSEIRRKLTELDTSNHNK